MQNRGYNLFARRDDWETTMLPLAKDAAPYEDYANMAPSLLEPGALYATRYRFYPNQQPPQAPTPLGVYRLCMGAGEFINADRLPFPNGLDLMEVPVDPGIFRQAQAAPR